MNQLQKIFDYQGAQLRTIIIDGEPWFVVNDVCRILEFSNPSETLKRLEDDEVSSVEVTDSLGRNQITNIVNEPGFYSLILGSRKPEAKLFKRWVTHEVLPMIRKTGQFIVNENNVFPLSKDQALVTVLRTTADLVERQEDLEQGQRKLEQKVAEIDHKVEEQITLTSGEQRKLQKEVAKRVYELAKKEEVQQLGFENDSINPDLSKVKDKLFRQLHRAIKDCFAVPSYKDVRRCDFTEVLKFVSAWRPRLVA